jgi:hypothetical protein
VGRPPEILPEGCPQVSENPNPRDFREMALRSAQVRRAAGLERHIRRVVDAAPPLTADQRNRLAELLAPQAPGSTPPGAA